MLDKPKIESITLYPWQTYAWNSLPTDALCILSRRAGKTFFLTAVVSFLLLLSSEAVTIAVFSPTRRKSYELIFEGVRNLLEAKSTSHITYHKSNMEILNTQSGARLRCYPLSAEHGSSCRGDQATVLIVDEISLCSAKEFYESALPMQSGLPAHLALLKRSIVSGTPSGGTNLMTRLFASYKKREKADKTDARIFHYPADKLEHISPEELEKLRLTMPIDVFEREYMASMEASSSGIMFAPTLITNAANAERDDSGHISYPETAFNEYREVTAGLDVGNRGDSTILYIKQNDQPLLLAEIRTDDNELITRSNMGLQHKQVLNLLQRYNCQKCAADSSGLGQFYCDELVDLCSPYGIDIRPIAGNQKTPYHHQDSYQNLRACLYGLLRKAMEMGHSIPDYHPLHEELSAVTIKDDPHSNKILLSPKKEIKAQLGRSTDYSDAVVYSYLFDSELDLDTYHATLRDVVTGKIEAPTTAEIMRLHPELYEDDTDDEYLDSLNFN